MADVTTTSLSPLTVDLAHRCNTTIKKCFYDCCNGLLLPIIDESPYSRGGRAFVYLVGLLYSFLGVAIAAEVFMIAIERITSTKKQVPIVVGQNADDQETGSVSSDPDAGYRMVKVWNPTVANLTLMALGSSAPEILLSCIEIIGNNFCAGKLGPGTIVGSAAFNLLVITAICISAIPSPDIRRVDAIMVFAVTASCSVFAYIWLLIILLGSSPNEVEVWEAFLTLFFFLVLIVVAFMADKRMLCFGKLKPKKEKGTSEEGTPLQDMSKSQRHLFEETQKKVAKDHPEYSAAQLAHVVANRIMRAKPRDRMYYRIQASRYFEGNRPLSFEDDDYIYKSPSIYPDVEGSETATLRSRTGSMSKTPPGQKPGTCTIEFAAKIYAFTEARDKIKIKVIRRGRPHKRIQVSYETVEGAAKKGEHFLHKKETLIFKPNEVEKIVDLELSPDGKWGEKDGFFVYLHLEEKTDKRMKIGTCHPAIVRFSKADGEPVYEFSQRNFAVKESMKVVRIPVVQSGGHATRAGVVGWKTQDVTAEDGKDYEGGQGELHFEADEVQKFLDIPIHDDKEEEKTETFKVYLEKGPNSEVGNLHDATVSIVSDDSMKEIFTQMDTMIPHFLSKMEPGTASWREQIVRAVSLNNGDTKGATCLDITMHILSFPFKVIFAFVPPPSILGGWPTFFVALGFIGLLTAIVGDLAGIFGCLVYLKDEVTAITFVALGTSLPDTFASKLAATQDPTADNAIGNVTGSNSVNVFLGLGLPWLIAASYWHYHKLPFTVKAGALGFSVAIYTTFSVLCLGLLVVRRYVGWFGKGELGGPIAPKWISAIFCLVLWCLYILLSALQAYCIIPFAGYTCN